MSTRRSSESRSSTVAVDLLSVCLRAAQLAEHVLRQCRIALRLAELIDLSEEERAAIYYSALIVNSMGPATPRASMARRSASRAVSLPPRLRIRQCASRGRIARRCHPRTHRARCALTSVRAASTPTLSKPYSVRPDFVAPGDVTDRPVLRLLVRDLSAKEIAGRLVISAKTATNHIEHIYTKIQVSNRAAASLYALQHGLLPDEDFAD